MLANLLVPIFDALLSLVYMYKQRGEIKKEICYGDQKLCSGRNKKKQIWYAFYMRKKMVWASYIQVFNAVKCVNNLIYDNNVFFLKRIIILVVFII